MTSYHVTLDGQGYILDLATYRKRLIDRGAKGELAELAPWQQDDWRRGVGYAAWEPGVMNDGVNIDPNSGDLRLGRSRTTVHSPGAGITDLWGLQVYAGSLYSPRGDGTDIYASVDGSVWTNPHDSGHGGHRGMCLFNGWLLIGASDGGEIVQNNAGVWNSAWVTLTGTKVASLASWYLTGTTPKVFAGVNQATGGAILYSVDAAAAIVTIATVEETEICALHAFGGSLWVGTVTESGSNIAGRLYRYDGVRLIEVAALPDNAITCFVEYRGALWAGSRTRGKLWTVSSAGIVERFTLPEVSTVGAGGGGGVSSYSLAMRQLLVDDDRIYVPAVTANGLGVYVGAPIGPSPGVRSPVVAGPTRTESVRTPPRPQLASADAAAGATENIPSMGWSTPAIGSSGQEPRGIASFQGQVYLTNKRSSGAGAIRIDGSTYNTTGVFVSSSFDAGRPGVSKLAVRLQIQHSALIAGDEVLVEYDVEDAGSWTTLGTSQTDGATTASFSFASSATFKRIRLRVTITVTDATRTPLIQALILEYRPKPVAKATWEFEARLEGTTGLPLVTLDGTPDPKTGAQLADALWATAAKSTALTFVDLDGESKTVEVVSVEEKVAPMGQRAQPSAYSTRGVVALQEL